MHIKIMMYSKGFVPLVLIIPLFIIIVASFFIISGSNLSYASQTIQNFILNGGQMGSIKCNGSSLGVNRKSKTEVALNCVSSASPIPTPIPSPSAMTASNIGKCGESMDFWHPPVVTGPDGKPCNTGHEHGDAPPSWIKQAGYDPMFMGMFNTSALENSVKHASMKGFLANFNGVDVYFRLHFASNPMERFGTYHSYEVFAKDPKGGVSHWQLWTYAGLPTSDARCPRRNPALPCESTRPIVLVTDQTSLDQGINCEQWYSDPGSPQWAWDFGWGICGSTTIYQKDKEQDQATAFDQSTWKATGNLGLTRRLEAAWYSFRSHPTGKFYSTQFGQLVSGPTDPKCSQTTTGKDGKSYPNICLEQYIAPTMTQVAFPNNSTQKTFPGSGVTLPN